MAETQSYNAASNSCQHCQPKLKRAPVFFNACAKRGLIDVAEIERNVGVYGPR